jgi:hypothetical protein
MSIFYVNHNFGETVHGQQQQQQQQKGLLEHAITLSSVLPAQKGMIYLVIHEGNKIMIYLETYLNSKQSFIQIFILTDMQHNLLFPQGWMIYHNSK